MLKKKRTASEWDQYINKIWDKPTHRLTPEEKEDLKTECEGRLKRMKWGMYRAEGTHIFTYQPQQELERSITEGEEESGVVMHALQPGDAQPDIWEVIRPQITGPGPCGGGRRVGFERFKGINTELGRSNSKE